MKITPTYGAPRTRSTQVVSWIAAGIVTVMLLAQLSSFEDFAATLAAVLPFNDQPLASAMAGGIVLMELVALPYLLGMYLSKLMRVVSALAAFVVCSFWLLLSLTNSHAGNSALFSTMLELPGGLIAATWSLILFGLIIRVIFADSRFRHSTAS